MDRGQRISSARMIVRCLTATCLAVLCGCGDWGPVSPSPNIQPNATTMKVGDAQVFQVLNGSVTEFNLSCDDGDWRQFVTVDQSFQQPNSIRLVAVSPLNRAYVYLRANMTGSSTTVVAVIAIGS
jgi:hypothetical protein